MSYDVLVVDDEKDVCNFLQSVLQGEGLSVRCAPNGFEALTLIRQEKPQLIVLDLVMPEMTGDQLCRIIKEDPGLRDIIVFILTSRGDVESKLACFRSGAEEYLVKPIDSRELTARVGRFIKMMDDLKAPGTTSNPSQTSNPEFTPKSNPEHQSGSTHPDFDMPSLALDEYSFIRFQSNYGNYRVESMVGKGGMGQVYKAKDEQLERYVAIKVLSPKLSGAPEFVERFRREAKVLASINHPGIASIYSFSEQKGEHYFAMQWCSGGSLGDMIRKKGRIEPMAAVDIMLQCGQALNLASKKGIVHRDIKPSNLMFDENQLIKIVDFGLAYAEQLSTNLTQGGEFLGTPSYMAPEQAKSPSVDQRADIYSLGITFYYMLYGNLPFQASSSIEMVIKHTSHPFPAYIDMGGKIPRSVYSIIEKMTQKDAAARYQDYNALIADLEMVRNEFLHQKKFKVPQASRIAPIATNTSTNFFEIMAMIHNNSQTGLLTCKWNTLEKKFLAINREIVLFDSMQPDENIWNYLVKKQILKKEDLPSDKNQLEQPLNRLLLNHAFSVEDFKKAYRELMLSALNQVFLWPVFEGTFATANIENDAFCSVGTGDFLLDAVRHTLDYSVIRSQIPANMFIKRTPNLDAIVRSLSLNPEESFIASRFEGENLTIDTLNMITGLPEEKIARVVFALHKFGAIQFKEPEVAKPQLRRDPSSTQTTSLPFRPVPIVEVASGYSAANPSSSTPSTTSRTAAAAPAQSPTPPPAPTSPFKQPSAPAPKSGASDSGASSEAGLREQFLQEMQRKRFATDPPTPVKEPAKETVRMEVQKSDKRIEVEQHVRTAEQFFRMAERKFEEEDFYNVTNLCKQAIANNPGEAKYYMLMAQAYSKHPRFLKDAQNSFQKATELDPWNPGYHVTLAEFYIDQGLSLRALNECKKALQLEPNHEKALELKQQLKDRDK